VSAGSGRRVALVAGGTSGLGLAIGRGLAEAGFAVALGGRRVELARREAEALPEALGVELDIVDSGSVAAAVAAARESLGPIDVVVLNGGGPPPSAATDLDLDAARAAAELLLHGPIGVLNHCLPSMRERSWGRVVAVGSSAVQQPIPGLATSSMYRTALASYLKLLAEECAPHGVTVNMVLPGRISTDRTAQLDAGAAQRTGRSVMEVRAASQATIPMRRYGTAAEFAAMGVFLCSDQARYVTGEQIRVDGGLVRAL
jgi:3-oxoacyl-[acyl-carrier protein] reductase